MNYKISISGPEEEMYNLLNMLSIEDNASILHSLAVDLPEEQQKFYKDEARFWKAIGQKQVLVQDIIDLIPADLLLKRIDAIVEDVIAKSADKSRYQPETQYWSPETRGPSRPQTVLTQEPGFPEISPEESRIRPHPEKDYLVPDLFNIDWPPGPPPPIPEEMPDFSSMSKEDHTKLYGALKNGIADELRGYPLGSPRDYPVTPPVPAPFIREMVLAYLDAVRPDYAMKLRDAGYKSIERKGFSLPKSMSYLTKYMPIEDLYIYWNSIVNHKVLPWTNTDFVIAQYHGSKEGESLPDLYRAWKSQAPAEEAVIPEETIDYWKEDARAPEWFNNVVGPTEYLNRLPSPPTPELTIEEPLEEPVIKTAPKPAPIITEPEDEKDIEITVDQ